MLEAAIASSDREILRRLASELAPIATLPVHAEKARLWSDLNQLRSSRPMVWINELPWGEMDVDGELTLRCAGTWARQIEWWLRTTLYQWRHLPADMIVSDFIPCNLVWDSTGFGIEQQGENIPDSASGIVSQHFIPQIRGSEDLEKIRMPLVSVDRPLTQARHDAMCDAFEGIMPVRTVGVKHIWYTPWDCLIRWYGVEEAILDMIDRPELVHAAVKRVADAFLCELDQLVQLNALDLNHNNTRIGSGGYGYTEELPGRSFDPAHVLPHNMWGCSNAQILSTVSPEMRWEFAVQHDLPWLSRWALTYYGCCEPLHASLPILRRIPNLRKISMSPFIDIDKAVTAVGDDYVFSYKPNPAMMADDRWNALRAREQLSSFLDRAQGCHVEIILKDVSTVRCDPRRVWEWEKIAMELVEQAAAMAAAAPSPQTAPAGSAGNRVSLNDDGVRVE